MRYQIRTLATNSMGGETRRNYIVYGPDEVKTLLSNVLANVKALCEFNVSVLGDGDDDVE